jgi:hypothetical protein
MLGTMELEEEQRLLVYRVLFKKIIRGIKISLQSVQLRQHQLKQNIRVQTSNRMASDED